MPYIETVLSNFAISIKCLAVLFTRSISFFHASFFSAVLSVMLPVKLLYSIVILIVNVIDSPAGVSRTGEARLKEPTDEIAEMEKKLKEKRGAAKSVGS